MRFRTFAAAIAAFIVGVLVTVIGVLVGMVAMLVISGAPELERIEYFMDLLG